MNKQNLNFTFALHKLTILYVVIMLLQLFFLNIHVVNAKPLRTIAVFGGFNDDYYDILSNCIVKLKNLKIIEAKPQNIGNMPRDLKVLWNWISANVGGKHLKFLKDGFYSADWDPKKRVAIKESVRTRLENRHDVDLILAFGTWSGIDMIDINKRVPVLISGVTDAITSGILPAETDKRKDNIAVIIEPDRYFKYVDVAYQIFGFKKLGISYDHTPLGRSIAAIDQIEKACKLHGVEIIDCDGKFFPNYDPDDVFKSMLNCHKHFVEKKVDAVFITYNSLRPEQIPRVIEPLIKMNIPTISQTGPQEVKMGVLTSVTNYDANEGEFEANLIKEIINNTKPKDLPYIMNSSISFCININTASRIGWNPSLDMLLSVDEFFH